MILDESKRVAPIGLMITEGAKELGNLVEGYLSDWDGTPVGSHLIQCDCPRFASGESKGLIRDRKSTRLNSSH